MRAVAFRQALLAPRSRAESSSSASPSSTLWRSRRRRRRTCGVSWTRAAFLSAAGGLTRSRRARRSASLLSDGLDSRASRRGSKDARSTVVPSDAVRRRLLAEHLLDPARAPGLRDLRGLDHDSVSGLGLHLALLPLAPPAADGPVPAGAGRRRRDRRSSERGTKTPWTRRRGWPRSRSLFAGEAPRLARMARRWIAGFRPGSEGRASRKTTLPDLSRGALRKPFRRTPLQHDAAAFAGPPVPHRRLSAAQWRVQRLS